MMDPGLSNLRVNRPSFDAMAHFCRRTPTRGRILHDIAPVVQLRSRVVVVERGGNLLIRIMAPGGGDLRVIRPSFDAMAHLCSRTPHRGRILHVIEPVVHLRIGVV